ncbi:hypothetical protein KY334_00825 [Candidatus Woesearchaeota archaeon]|nr:hypothetical protein [Candidatus Woesearchaeota archaeon]
MLNKIKQETKDFANSFRINNHFLTHLGIDLLFWLVVGFVGLLWFRFGLAQVETLQRINTLNYQLSLGDLDQIPVLTPLLIKFFMNLVMFSVIFLVVFFMVWSISRVHLFNTYFNHKINKKFYLKFFLLKIVWQLFWLPLIIVLLIPFIVLLNSKTMTADIAQLTLLFFFINIILYLIIAYFGMFLYSSFFEHKKIYQSFTEAFSKGIYKLKHMIIPFILISLFFLICYALTLFLQFKVEHSLIFIIFLFFYVFTVVRIYILNKVVN